MSMNLNSGVRVCQPSTGLVGNIMSVGAGGAVTCVTREGVEFVCGGDDIQTLKGRPRKMTVAEVAAAPACEASETV